MNTLTKRLIVFGLVALVAVIVLFSIFRGQSQTTGAGSSKNTENKQLAVSLLESKDGVDDYTDTDNDGAYDWEEKLWPELDPNNPDSDGDGVLDGQYIQNQRQIQQRQRQEKSSVVVESNLSETEKLGRLYLSALLAIEQSGGEITPEDQEKINENIRQYITALPVGEKKYTRSDVLLVEDTQENAYKYRDTMTDIFIKYPVSSRDIELIILSSSGPENAEYQGLLRAAEIKYAKYLQTISEIQVPRVIATHHVDLLNSISHLHGSFQNILDQDQDELKSLTSLLQIESVMNQVVEAITNINTFFDIIQDPSVFDLA